MTREYPSLGHLAAHYVDLYLLTLGANGYFSMQLLAEHEKGPCEKYGLLSFSWFVVLMTWFVLGCVTYEVTKLTASSYGIARLSTSRVPAPLLLMKWPNIAELASVLSEQRAAAQASSAR